MPSPSLLRPRWLPWRAWPRRQLLVGALGGVVGGGLAYGISYVLAVATCPNGGCPTANAPAPFVLIMAAVVAWAAASGAR